MIGNKIEPFKFWCQKVLPNVYDDSLSYYEYLCKLNKYLDDVITQMNTLTEAEENFQEDLTSQWNTYKTTLTGEWNTYKTELTAEWNAYKNDLTAQWTTTKNYIDNYFNNLNVQTEINNKLDAMVTDGTLTNLISPLVAEDIPTIVTTWLTENVDPVGSAVTVDSSLTISGSAADAKVTGDKITELEDELEAVEDYGFKTIPRSVAVTDIPNLVTFSGGGYLTSGGNGISIFNNANYQAYYLVATEEMALYVDAVGSGNLGTCMLGYGSDYTDNEVHTTYTTLLCDNNVVYRDSDIPITAESAITVPVGGVVAFAWSGTGTMKVFGLATAKTMGDPLKDDVQDMIDDTIEDMKEYLVKDVPVSVNVTDIDGIIYSANHYASQGVSGIEMYENNNYKAYYLLAEEETTVYVDALRSGTLGTVMLGVGTNYSGVETHSVYYTLLCDTNTVYRDSSVPASVENAVTVPAGGVLAVSWSGNGDMYLYGFKTEVGMGDPLKSDIEDMISGEIGDCEIIGDGSTVDITCEKLKVQIKHIVDGTKNLNCWRIYSGSIIDNGVAYAMWGVSDADGVIKLANETDFIGGYHGDEITTDVTLLIDGEEVNIAQAIASRSFRNVDLFVTSKLYHDGSTSPSDTDCFVREKHIHLEKNKLQLLNVWTATEGVNVITGFVGMFSVDQTSGSVANFITGYTTNVGASLLGDTDETSYDENLHDATFYLKKGIIEVKDYGCFNGNYMGQVMYYSDSHRLKVYLDNAAGSMQIGDTFGGGYILEVK